MKTSDVKFLPDEGIQAELMQLDKEKARAMFYKGLHNSDEGKLLVEHMKGRITHIRKLYSFIPPGAPNAGILLAGLQAEEFEMQEWVDRIELNDRRSGVLEAYMSELREELKDRAKRRQEDRRSFLPTGYKKEKGVDNAG